MNFVISGKAITVFKLIELKAKRQQELESLLAIHSCPVNGGKCSRPRNESCEDCPVWKEIDGE